MSRGPLQGFLKQFLILIYFTNFIKKATHNFTRQIRQSTTNKNVII